MEARYQKLAKLNVRNLADYNAKLGRINDEELDEGVEPEKVMPQIVIVIDEFADLMLTAPADVETSQVKNIKLSIFFANSKAAIPNVALGPIVDQILIFFSFISIRCYLSISFKAFS